VRSQLHGWINCQLLGLACVGALIPDNAPISAQPQAPEPLFMETKQSRDTRFITSLTRLTACTIPPETDIRHMVPLYPMDSRKYHEEGKVIMQFVIDSDSCVRKATISQSSGYHRLDKASLDFAMNLRFPPSMLSNVKSFDDGRPTFAFPIVWKLTNPVPYDPEDRCSHGARCIDEAPPPPKTEDMGASPEPGDIWMPGYYVYYAKTGYQWNDGQWEPPRPGYHWNAPYWEKSRSKWLFIAGGWEKDK
jgi:TonB family protein